MKFGDKLQVLRKEKGLTHDELSQILSVNEADIYFFEKSLKYPTYKLLNRIADYFSVTSEYLIGKSDIDKTVFGNRLRKLRKDKLINQPELSGVINVCPSNISYYEQGKSLPSVETLERIADFFNVSIDYLLGRSDVKNPEENKVITKAFHNIDVDGLPDEAIEEVEKYVELIKLKYKSDRRLKKK